ncbi:DUF1778 domain-containing protein [Corallococcus exiguus]|uniref:type II toxin -antitoxin system TacA 1-like antitoxin n=1 Tax=Corallococcus TaxID=83461 RepID=UPI001315445D|nr:MULTISPECIES: DUF1778 domain-containing protein [Corallococcus]NNB85339.1 DUF1778 domain-containing protein [Corallococcus exiguus]NNB93063.1 DUF1778 domain-containing protein [Corallococcus exiguus]NNC03106.1 DUF1778 domain-containing protein [Corallococcus exiguus]NNC14498.1 DUF1778 domain-containing protein [Corallococcus exiguus]NPC45575.1 DUF1778 domain-containing protein [Corallococcus exiguus]
MLAEDDSPSIWNEREEVRVVLPDSDFDRLVDALEKPAKPLPRLLELARKKAR